jgi:hypothetical protein
VAVFHSGDIMLLAIILAVAAYALLAVAALVIGTSGD